MSTPIEIVRESLAKLQDPFVMFHARPEKKAFTEALASVLRDAERFKALERAFEKHNSEGAISVMRWKGKCVWHYTKEPDIDGATLAELADRLREGAR